MHFMCEKKGSESSGREAATCDAFFIQSAKIEPLFNCSHYSIVRGKWKRETVREIGSTRSRMKKREKNHKEKRVI